MQIYKSTSHQKGVTIVELLVYVGLLSIFMVVLLDVFTSILGAKLESQSTSSVSQDTRYILAKLNYDILNADSISAPAAFGISSNTLTLVSGGNYYEYSVDGSGSLNIKDYSSGDTKKLNGGDSEITDISFTKLGNSAVSNNKPTVKISFTVRSLVQQPSGPEEETIDTTMGTR